MNDSAEGITSQRKEYPRSVPLVHSTELEKARADGKREALIDVLSEIDKQCTNYIYQRAGKRIAIAVNRMLKAVNASITQA